MKRYEQLTGDDLVRSVDLVLDRVVADGGRTRMRRDILTADRCGLNSLLNESPRTPAILRTQFPSLAVEKAPDPFHPERALQKPPFSRKWAKVPSFSDAVNHDGLCALTSAVTYLEGWPGLTYGKTI
ncbi:hypothetical protein OKW41_000405 [Paraburkholderia sp. UCT70]|uniref:Uncharacterized protein n=1 Tax=Paraburkholderia podalyriae TaxID=1938811 RepID=A0ABR7PZ99_9BURK|nr:hypothetical protein [Paraburkholderia podalyriae]MBC8751578.1 hypothetical protein [Paraburkholderia podalyriae]